MVAILLFLIFWFVKLIAEDIRQIKEARIAVEKQALKMFEQGLNTQVSEKIYLEII